MYKIIDINWVRANLILKLNKNIENDCYICFEKNKTRVDYNKNEITISIYNTPVGSAIEEGQWNIMIGEEIVKLDTELLKLLDDKSRIFKYRANLYSLLVTYDVDDDLVFSININYMMKNRKYKKMNRLAAESFFGKIRVIYYTIGVFLVNLLYKIVNIFMKDNTVLFLTENSNDLPVNMIKLYEKVNAKYTKKMFCVDIYNHKNKLVRLIELFKIATSKYIIVDNYVSLTTRLRLSKKHRILQLWHAGIGFKAVGYARFGKPGSPHPFISSHRKYSNAVVDNEKLIDIYQEVFGCSKDIFWDCGIPKLDDYLDKDTIEEVSDSLFNRYEVLKDKKIILFSPTYRGNGSGDAYYDFNLIDLKRVNEFCKKNNFVFVIKMHPFIKDKFDIDDSYQNILDLSDENINDLIYISDIMITDYSSCAYEFSFFDRPLIFYRFDKDLYEYLRPMHTVDEFCKKQFEVTTFDDLMSVLAKNKDIDISKRFGRIKNRRKNSASTIIDKFLGGE